MDDDTQKIVLETNVIFLGRKYILSSLRDMMNAHKFNEIINKVEIKELLLKSFKNEDWDLGHYEIPKPLPYYIQRKFTIQRKLNPAIFNHKCSDIFLLEGIEPHHLSILAKPELTAVSTEQRNKVTRRFILLKRPVDYDKITKVAKNPVHRIKHEDNQFFWVSTSGSCQIIRVFLKYEEEEIAETTFVNDHLSTFNNRPIAICSGPGMGKSILLANLEANLRNSYPKRITIFLELHSLIPKFPSGGAEVTLENIRQILISSPSISLLGQEILLEFLHCKDLIFEIFLDGFDEVSVENLQLANEFLKCLLTFPNMRVYITSRLHLQNEIENALEVISLNIAPFNQANQLNFLCDFWSLDQNIKKNEKLSEFGLKVLDSLEFINENNSLQTEFAGIPLQCSMLAKIYAEQAEMHCNLDSFHFKATCSLYEMYTEFMKFRFEKIDKSDRKLVKMFHAKVALALLFPDDQKATKIIEELNKNFKLENIPWEKVFALGILEQAFDKPNFVHRTFAEFLLAEFVIEELVINQVVGKGISIPFIFESMLRLHKTTKGQIFNSTLYY